MIAILTRQFETMEEIVERTGLDYDLIKEYLRMELLAGTLECQTRNRDGEFSFVWRAKSNEKNPQLH
jgi:hypothetical protein